MTEDDLKELVLKIQNFSITDKEPETKEELEVYIKTLAEQNGVVSDAISEIIDTMLICMIDPNKTLIDLEWFAGANVRLADLLSANTKMMHWAAIKLVGIDDPMSAIMKAMNFKI